MAEWQPIETAPKGREVLISYPDVVCLGVYQDDGWWVPDVCPYKWTELITEPTDWMPLPPPPQENENG